MAHLRVLGALDLQDRDGSAVRDILAHPKRLALLVHLLLARPSRFHRRDALLALLWPELDQSHARNALRQVVHHLRRGIGAAAVPGRGDEIGIDRAQVGCDALAFRDALAAGDLERALDLYGGDLLPGFFVSGAPGFEDWLESERVALRREAAEAARSLALRDLAAGREGAAGHWARRAVTLALDDEEVVRWCMNLMEQTGDRAGALRLYQNFERRMADAYEAEPSAETRAVAAALTQRDSRPTLRRQPAPAPSKPDPDAPAPAVRTRRRTWLPLSLTVIGAVLVLGFSARRWWLPSRTQGDPNLVAVVPFDVMAPPEDTYLGEAMALELAWRLDGAGSLRTVDPRVLGQMTGGKPVPADNAAEARGLAVRTRAGLYVVGEVLVGDSGIEVRATLYDREQSAGRGVRARASGSRDQALAVVDRVATQLLAARTDEAAPQVTNSLPALRAYLSGEAEYRAGRYAEAIPHFARAVALDSGFGRALYRLSVSAEWAGAGAVARAADSAAARVRSTMTVRDRTLFDALEAYQHQDAVTAEWHYRNLLSTNPSDVEATIMLGETLFHYDAFRGRPFLEARATFERALALEPGNANTLLHLARLAAFERRPRDLADLVQRFLARVPEGDRAEEARALLAFGTGDLPAQREVMAGLDTATSVVVDVVATAVAVYAHNLDAAADMARRLDGPRHAASWQCRGHLMRAGLLSARGHWIDARHELALAGQLDPALTTEVAGVLAAVPESPFDVGERRNLRERLRDWYHTPVSYDADSPTRWRNPAWGAYLAGLLSNELHDSTGLATDEAALAAMPHDLGGWTRPFGATLASLAAQDAGTPWAALTALERGDAGPRSPGASDFFHALADERLLHAELLEAVGRTEEARGWYQSFPAPNGWDLPYLAIASLRRAELAERVGDRASAARDYAQVIQLWGDGDPATRPFVARARAGLRRVGSREPRS